MSRSWYWKVAFVALLAVFATLYVIPSLVRDREVTEVEQKTPTGEVLKDDQGNPIKKLVVEDRDNLPKWYPGAFRKYITLGLDLQGGVLLQYGVDLYEALRGKADLYAEDIDKQLTELLEEKGIKAVPQVKRVGIDQIQITADNPEALAQVDTEFVRRFQVFDQSGKRQSYVRVFDVAKSSGGEVLLQLSSDYQSYLERYAIDQAVQTISDRVDKLAVKEPEIRKGASDTIVIQLPGLSDADFGQAQSIIEQTAQLQFKRVDDGNPNPGDTSNMEYLTGLTKLPRKGSAVQAFPESVGNEVSAGGTSYYFRAELGKFFCFFGIHIPRNGTNSKFTVCVIQNCRSQAASLGTGRAKDGNDFLGCHKNVVMIIIENFLK